MTLGNTVQRLILQVNIRSYYRGEANSLYVSKNEKMKIMKNKKMDIVSRYFLLCFLGGEPKYKLHGVVLFSSSFGTLI